MHRSTRKRIITSGVVVPGRIVEVEKTDTSVNDGVVHRIVIRSDAEGGGTVTAKMGSEPAKTARRMMEGNVLTWDLVDPRKPDRGLWPHGWSLEARGD